MLQWFIRFPEFSESSASFRKNSIVTPPWVWDWFSNVTVYNVFQYDADADARCGLPLSISQIQ